MSRRIEDIACFGQFHLQQDRWSGRQLVPAAWVDETTPLQTANGSDPAGTNELGPECDLTLRLRFFGDKIAVDLEQDLSFGESTPAHLVGKVSSPAETQ